MLGDRVTVGTSVKYFKNTELAKIYKVSEKSVRNWIQAAQDGKLDLQLFSVGSKEYVANTTKNNNLIEKLVAKGRKYKNTRGYKVISPGEDFYNAYDEDNIIDIISNLDVHREIPHKYSYFGEGAKFWDGYANRMAAEPVSNLKNCIQLLDVSDRYFDQIMADYSGVNVVDLGVGNALTVKNLLEHLIKGNHLNRYIALDTSDEMLNIAEKNILDWFGGSVKFERYIRDINYDMFNDIILEDTFTVEKKPILNIVLLLGGTIANLRDPDLALSMIGNSLGKNDLFVLSKKLDTEFARRFFDFDVDANFGSYMKEKANLSLLGLDEDTFTLEQRFDEQNNKRVIQAKLKSDISLNFKIGKGQRVVELHKGESILLWYAHHHTMIQLLEMFDRNGFEVVQASKSKDEQYAQVVAKIKRI